MEYDLEGQTIFSYFPNKNTILKKKYVYIENAAFDDCIAGASLLLVSDGMLSNV